MGNYGDMDVCDNDPDVTKRIRRFYRGDSPEASDEHESPQSEAHERRPKYRANRSFSEVLQEADKIMSLDPNTLENLSKEAILLKLKELKNIGYPISGYKSLSYHDLVEYVKNIQLGIRGQISHLSR